MSMRDYEKAKLLLEAYPTFKGFNKGCSENLVKKAEVALELQFPPIYRRFLLEYGVGSFGSQEFYGITGDNFEASSIPNAIWYTFRLREKWSIPHNFIPIGDDGRGYTYVIRVSAKENDPSPVTLYKASRSLEHQPKGILAEDFGKHFLICVEREIEFISYDSNE